jgi:tRNA/rRNA methyltransferase
MTEMRLDNIRVVLVGPLYGGNVGSVCRAMANMGLSDLAIAAPRPLNVNEAHMMACHAGHLFDERGEFATLADAVADCGMVVGTTARRGLYRQHSCTPREAAPELLRVATSGKTAMVFGREDNGLTNDELALCTQVVRIPTTERYASLNIAQAVMVCCYEVFVAANRYEPPEEKSPLAPSELRERMFGMWRETLLRVGFMKDDKADHMMMGLRRVLARGALTCDDVHIMMGVARQTDWAASRPVEERDEAVPPPETGIDGDGGSVVESGVR